MYYRGHVHSWHTDWMNVKYNSKYVNRYWSSINICFHREIVL